MKRIRFWLFKKLHENDDYSVRVPCKNNIGGNYYIYATPWMTKAVVVYIYLHFKYPKDTIILTHHKYRR